MSEVSGAPVTISRKFSYQSFFDSTLLERGLLLQSGSEMIVSSTREATPSQVSGYALGLHPTSQTPVAVEFTRRGGSASQVMTLVPGQIVRPFGNAPFNGFASGLPFGWLGGGVATMVIFRDVESDMKWATNVEVAFHRQRMQIKNAFAVGSIAAKFNWPVRFPWPGATRSVTAYATTNSQAGSPAIGVTPTRTIVRLRSEIAAQATCRFLVAKADEFDLSSADTFANPEQVAYFDADFPGMTTSGSSIGGTATAEYPTLVFVGDSHPLVRLGGDSCYVVPIAITAALNNVYLDVIRYGRL